MTVHRRGHREPMPAARYQPTARMIVLSRACVEAASPIWVRLQCVEDRSHENPFRATPPRARWRRAQDGGPPHRRWGGHSRTQLASTTDRVALELHVAADTRQCGSILSGAASSFALGGGASRVRTLRGAKLPRILSAHRRVGRWTGDLRQQIEANAPHRMTITRRRRRAPRRQISVSQLLNNPARRAPPTE